MRASKSDIRIGLRAIRKMAEQAFNNNEDQHVVSYLDTYSNIAGQFNFYYTDNKIEDLFIQLSNRHIKKVTDWNPNSNRWILFDDFCSTYVLGLQWLEAMACSGKDILYITTRDINAKSRHRDIMADIANFKNVTTIVIPQGDVFFRAQRLYDEIAHFQASKIVLHKSPTSSISNFVLPILPDSVQRYIINLSDQTFWAGVKSIDYCLEFRPFGASVSIQRRGLKKEQLLMVPFYPADDKNAFQGFPVERNENRIIVFSGGDYYKTLDKDRTYWNLVRELLISFPQVDFIFATKNIPEGDAEIRQFIADNRFEERFFYIAFRPDIFQVLAHCDIYLGTCPTSGSLMSQLAAINAKPILQYYAPGTQDDETEQAICINDFFPISHSTHESFFKEAANLIHDPEYRKSFGLRLQRAMMQHMQFNELSVRTLETNISQIPLKDYKVNFKEIDERWYYLEKGGYTHTLNYIYSLLKARNCLLLAPSIFYKKNINRLFSSATKG